MRENAAMRTLHEIQRVGTNVPLRGITCIASDPSEELIWTGNDEVSRELKYGIGTSCLARTWMETWKFVIVLTEANFFF